MISVADQLTAGHGWPAGEPRPGPLAGVAVLDLSRVLAGPYAGMVLADLGADVLKVERAGVGDDTRRWGPPFHGDDAAYFFAVNRDRRSLALDLAAADGRAVVRYLVMLADVVLENFLPAQLERLGLADLRSSGDGPVWVSVRGAGSDGTDGDLPGYDVMAQARSGLMSVTGTDRPTKVGVAAVDVVSGLYAAVCAVAGLVARRGPGTGSTFEVPLLDVGLSMLVNQASNHLIGAAVPGPTGNDHPNLYPYGPVDCADRPLVVGAGNDTQFAALCAAVGLHAQPGWATNSGRVADRVALAAALRQAMGGRTAAQWAADLGAAGVPCAVVQDLPAVVADPHVVATGQIAALDHPAGQVRVVGSPLLVDGARPRPQTAPPTLGQHSVEVLTALGLDADTVERLTA